jgi:hypothetical protein
MKTFTLFWLTGDKEIVQGLDIADAVRRSGYGGGAMAALDFWSEGNDEKENWTWNSTAHKWEWSESKKKKLGLIK